MLNTNEIIYTIHSAGRWLVIGYKIGDRDITIGDMEGTVSKWSFDEVKYMADHSVDIRTFITPAGNRALCVMFDSSDYGHIAHIYQRPLSQALKIVDKEAASLIQESLHVDGNLVERKNAFHQMVHHGGVDFLQYLKDNGGCKDLFDMAYIKAMYSVSSGNYWAGYLPAACEIFNIYNKLRNRMSSRMGTTRMGTTAG